MGKDVDEAKTHLRWVPMSLLRKKKISTKLSASTVERKAIMLTSVLRKRSKSQKTSSGLGNFYVGDCS